MRKRKRETEREREEKEKNIKQTNNKRQTDREKSLCHNKKLEKQIMKNNTHT